jgi:hypothetical protein
LSLNKDWNDSTGAERERPVAEHAKNAANLATMRGDRDPSVIVAGKDLVQSQFRASVLRSGWLGDHTGPKLIILCETRLDVETGEQVLDVRLVAAVVAGVGGDTLAEKLLNGGDEGVVVRELQVRERDVSGAEAASQRRGVV